MKTLKALSTTEANENTQAIFSAIRGKVGAVPNLYAAMGNSDKLLGGFLALQEAVKSGEFSAKEYEAIALSTSQVNGCAYCLAAHTTLGKMNGFSEDETLALRSGSIDDSKLNALVSLVTEIADKKGHPSNEAVERFFEAGYNKAAFTELIGAIALTTITNTIYANGDFEIDFPKAQNIAELQNA